MHNAPIGRNRSLTLRAGGGYIRHMAEKRKFLGVHFKCCTAYARVYMNKEKTAYRGACPRCCKRVDMRIGREGTDSRFFTAQ